MNIDYAAIAILITALGAAIVNIIVALRTNDKVNEVQKKQEQSNDKIAIIEGHVNGEKSRDSARIVYLQKEIELRQEMLNEQKRIAALLAQAQAISAANVAKAGSIGDRKGDVPNVTKIETVLMQIESNTSDTEESTSSIDEKIPEGLAKALPKKG